MSNSAIVFAIVAGIVVLFVWNRIPVVLVAVGTALALYATGVLDLGQSLAGFWRFRRHLYCIAVRGQRRPRCDRRDGMGGATSDQPGGTEPRPPAGPHVDARRVAHGID